MMCLFVCVPESQCKDNTWGRANVLQCLPMSLNVLKCLDKVKKTGKYLC